MTDKIVVSGYDKATGQPKSVDLDVTAGSAHVTNGGEVLSDQGADLALTTTALSGGSGAQAIPTGTTHIRFQLKAIAAGPTAWANIKFGDAAVVVTSSTGTALSVGDGPITMMIPSTATHFDAISGANLTLNWTPA